MGRTKFDRMLVALILGGFLALFALVLLSAAHVI